MGYRSVAHCLILSKKSSAKAESTGAVSEDKDDVLPNGARRSLTFTSACERTTECNSPMDVTMEENNSASNDTRKFLSFTSASITTTESNSSTEMTKDENNSLPNLASPKSELGSDCQMKSDASVSLTDNSHGDVLVPLKSSLNCSECSDKQCDCGDVEIIAVTTLNDHSKCKTKRISSNSEDYLRGGIAQRLRPRVTTKESC